MVRKKCLVPVCPNTSDNSDKIFLYVPKCLDFRRQWGTVLKVPDAAINNSSVVCEDHFDLEKDAANWMYYKTIGKKLTLKKDVLPHKYIESPPPIDLPSCLSDTEKKRKLETLRNYYRAKSRSLGLSFKETVFKKFDFVKVEMNSRNQCPNVEEEYATHREFLVDEIQCSTENVVKENDRQTISVKIENNEHIALSGTNKLSNETSPVKTEDTDVIENFSDDNGSQEEFHEETNSEEKDYTCDFCGYSTSQEEDLERHIDLTHMKFRDLRCYLCNYHATKKSRLRLHMNLFHLNPNSYKCNLCYFVGNQRSDLQNHLNSAHVNMKPQYKCHLCDYTSSKRSLKIHMDNVHLKVRRFMCTFCDYASNHEIRLRKHMNLAHREQQECRSCADKKPLPIILRRRKDAISEQCPFECKV
ncbi:transcriptional repressor CTCFL-like [Coccinella septempunctata]|uniref:transcriptional repressor CTCFL-like n=1 Tax=Coccinella septempunctata TaxID=41139 RepID=UPI001D072FF9|nr:transcriptional repressor CTCFL-like [Coccinella septempunctata]